jgi:tRNA modification GTPase
VSIQVVAFHLVDTAGIRDTEDAVEMIGVQRSREELSRASLVLVVEAVGDVPVELGPLEVPVIRVVNKIDLLAMAARKEAVDNVGVAVYLSAKSGDGIDLLRQALCEVAGVSGVTGDATFIARARHLDALGRARGELCDAGVALESGAGLELAAEGLRRAHKALQFITGEFSSDDLLGEIFGQFCIGK